MGCPYSQAERMQNWLPPAPATKQFESFRLSPCSLGQVPSRATRPEVSVIPPYPLTYPRKGSDLIVPPIGVPVAWKLFAIPLDHLQEYSVRLKFPTPDVAQVRRPNHRVAKE